MDKNIASLIDHTNLKSFATKKDIEKLCEEANEYGFASVCVNPSMVGYAAKTLTSLHSKVKVCPVIGFPLGATTISSKEAELAEAIKNGASEVDYVVNIGKVKEGDFPYVKEEMRRLTDKARALGAVIKVIFENCYLRKDEVEQLSKIAKEIQPDFIKTSTGFGTYGALVRDVMLMKHYVGDNVQVKAAGGIRTKESAKDMIEAGATRIGTSNGINIVA